MINIALLALIGLSEPQLPSVWTVSLPNPQTALQRFQTNEYGGLLKLKESFIVGRDDGLLERRLLDTGEVLWSIRLPGAIQSLWSVDGDSLFGGDTKGHFYRIQLETGKVMWTAATKGTFLSQPLVFNNSVYVMNSLGTLSVYDKETGEWKWQQADPQVVASGILNFRGPVIWRNTVIVGFPSGNLQALSPETGEVLWKESFNTASLSADGLNDVKSVVIDEQLLVVSAFSGQLKVWQTVAGSKKLLWEKKLSLHTPATILDDTLYYSARDGSVGALDLKNGFDRWKKDLPRGLGTTPMIDKNQVWIGTSTGEIFVFAINGEILAHRESVESAFWNPPLLLGNDEALFFSSKGVLRRLHLASFFDTKSQIRLEAPKSQ